MNRQGWVNFDCPFCEAAGKYHMGYRIRGGYLNCWQCGKHRVYEVLTELGMTAAEARVVSKSIGDTVELEIEAPKRGKLVLPSGIVPMMKQHKRYLKDRGFKPNQLARLWGFQGIGLHWRLSWRIFIPIYLGNDIVSWTTRSIDKNVKKRYISAAASEEAINHKELLFGEQYARGSILIHEGPLDVVAVGPGAVATLGVDYTPAQLLRMSKYPRRVVCFDASPDAQKRARRLCDELEVYDGETINVKLETGDDPAEASRAEIKELRRRFL